jgi:excinuclease UvrABC nuclease subunit
VQGSLSWRTRKLEREQKAHIPTSSGIYTLIIKPDIVSHPESAYLMYVGQAVDLRDRFEKYITTERRRRPKVYRLLLKWEGHIFFCYTEVAASDLDFVEDGLLSSFLPPANSNFPGDVQPVVGAF